MTTDTNTTTTTALAMEIAAPVTADGVPEKMDIAPEKLPRAKNWTERDYFVRNDCTGELVATGFVSEKACREWLNSDDAEFDVPYTLGYTVHSTKTLTKTKVSKIKLS